MTREETKEAIKVMQAFVDGKEIESKEKNGTDWEGGIIGPGWHWWTCDYRVKPEPHYRPFESAEEVMEAIREHGGFIKDPLNNRFVLITAVDNTGIWWDDNMARRDFSNAAEYTFFDGTPFGKLVEE